MEWATLLENKYVGIRFHFCRVQVGKIPKNTENQIFPHIYTVNGKALFMYIIMIFGGNYSVLN